MATTFKSLLQRRQQARNPLPPAQQRAQALLDAIDAGGVPLNPAIVNDIARQLGLATSTQEPMNDTIERIRQAMAIGR